MTDRPIALDLTRLVTRLRHASPSGIDRVDLAYARHVLAQDGDRFGLVSTAFGPRVLGRAEARAIVEAVAHAHGGSVSVDSSDAGAVFTVRLPLDRA